jgi:hypothetical protein
VKWIKAKNKRGWQQAIRLEHQSRTLRLLVTTGGLLVRWSWNGNETSEVRRKNVPELEVLGALQRQLLLGLA